MFYCVRSIEPDQFQKKTSNYCYLSRSAFEKVVTKKELDKNTLKVAVGDNISIDFINEVLFEYRFKRVDFITEPGEFSVRGGIVDVFLFRMTIRIELSFLAMKSIASEPLM